MLVEVTTRPDKSTSSKIIDGSYTPAEYNEEDMLQALHQGYRNGHSDGVLYDMKDIAPEYPTFEQWLTEYKKNKK